MADPIWGINILNLLEISLKTIHMGFEIVDYESKILFKKFKMVDPIWRQKYPMI